MAKAKNGNEARNQAKKLTRTKPKGNHRLSVTIEMNFRDI